MTVTFRAHEDRTLVVLTHDGWESFADPAAARADYDEGWPAVLGRFEAHVSASTWVALLHRPGPQAPSDEQLFTHPEFAEHLAFLHRMNERGYLVAAGPLADRPGEGMTILRLPGADSLAEATRLATEDDRSVAGGFFTVTVRPWHVVLSQAAYP